MDKALVLALAACAFLRPVSGQEAAGQLFKDGELTDQDFRFHLAPRASSWVVLPETDSRKLSADSIAAMTDRAGLVGVVIAERVPGLSIESYAKTILSNMALEGKEGGELESVKFQGLDAIRYWVSGRFQDVPVTFDNIVFGRDEFAFQLTAWGPQSLVDRKKDPFKPFHEGFRLLDGKVVGRQSLTTTHDTAGVGWRVKSNRYQSAVYGLTVEPASGWRVVVGDELRAMNASASVGLVHTQPELYAIVICEKAAGVEKDEFLSHVKAGIAENLRRERDNVSHKVGAIDLAMETYELEGPPAIHLRHGAFFQGDLCIQVQAWCLKSLRAGAEKQFQEALKVVRFLDDKERDALAQDLQAGSDPQNLVGPGFALRRGIYYDFGKGFTWTKPSGFWQILAGSEARKQHQDATLHLEAPAIGLFGIIIAEEGVGLDGKAYHDTVVKNMFKEGHPARDRDPEKLKLGDAEARSTTGDLTAGIQFTYRVVTAVVGDRAFQFLLWGTPGNMFAAKDAVNECISGLSIHKTVSPAATTDAGTHRDFRLGFELKAPADDWRFEKTPIKDIDALGTSVNWRRGAKGTVCVIALCSVAEGQDENWFSGLLETLFKDKIGESVNREARQSETEIAGFKARRLSWKIPSGRIDIFSLMRDKTYYALASVDEGEGVSVEAAMDCFRLLR